MTDSTGLTTYGYDTAGRLATITGLGTNVAYTYDPAGNRATMSSAGKTTSYTYDGANRLATVSRPGIGTFGFTYNPDGELATITRPNGVTSTNSYDTAGRLTGLTYKNAGGTTIAAYAYTLDADGNRISASSAGASDHYAIDPAGRLTGVTYADGTAVSFGYDAAGNRTSASTTSSTTTYSYNADEELTSAGSTTYTYDPAGNRLTAGSSAYTYDSFGNLASATAGATTIAYQTNGAGLRVSATSGGTTTAYTWDAAANLPSLLSDGTAGYLSADSTLLAETAGSATTTPLTDALGSVRAQTDSTGAISASATYGVDGDVRSSSGSVGALGYTGALTDASGLVYLNARSLDPGTGTFTSRDPETPGGPGVTGFNPYAYAGQNPTTLTDPSGRGDAIEFTETFVDVVEPTATTGEVAGEEISGGIETVAQDGGDAVESLPDETPTTPEAGDPGVGGSGEAGGGGSGDIGEPPAEGPGVGDGGDGGGGSGINTDQSLGCDPAHGGAFNPDEYQTALRVQQERGVWLTRSSDPALEWEDLAGNTYDAMGPIPQQYFDQELSNIEAQLATHLDKATYIPFDVTGLTPVQISVVQQLIAGYGPGVFIVGM